MESLRSFFDTVSRWSIYALAALVPLFVVPISYVTVLQAKLFLVSGLVGLAALSWLLASLFARSFRIPRNTLFVAVFLLPIAYVISAFTVGWPNAAVVSGLAEQDTVVTASILAAICVLVALTQKGETVMNLVRAFTGGAGLVALFHGARLIFPEALTLGGVLPNSTASVVGTWHDLGIILGLLVIACGTLTYTRAAHSNIWRWGLVALGSFSFVFLLIISMQDIWFVLAGILALFGLYTWFAGTQAVGENHSKTKLLILPAIWVLLAVTAFVCGWYNVWIHDRLPEQIKIVSVEVRPSWEGTLSVGQNSLIDSRTRIFGTGPNTFARNWAQFKPAGVNETLFWNLDFANGVGVVPTSLVTIGALGIGAWMLIILAFLWTAGDTLRKEKLFGSIQTATFGYICATAFLLAFHIMYAPGLAVSVLLFMFFGILIVQAQGSHSSIPINLDRAQNVATTFVAIIVTGGVLFTSGISVLALTSDTYVNRSVALYAQNGNVGESSALIQKSLSAWSSNDRAHRAAVELGILELAQLGQRANTDEEVRKQLETTLSQTIEHGLKAVSIDGADYQNWLTLAQLYQELAGVGIQGAYEQAQQAYTKAREENPTNPLPLFRLGQLETLRGNTSNAIDYFSEAVKVKRDFAPAYFLQSQLLAQQNRLDEAIASGAAAVQLIPEDPLGWYNLGAILYVKGSFNEAGTAFSQAVNLRSDYSNALFMLGLTYYQVGGLNEAVVALTRVQELNPSESSIPLMIQNIKGGKAPFDGLTQPQSPSR